MQGYLLYSVKWEEKHASHDLIFVYTQVDTHVDRKRPVEIYVKLLIMAMPEE